MVWPGWISVTCLVAHFAMASSQWCWWRLSGLRWTLCHLRSYLPPAAEKIPANFGLGLYKSVTEYWLKNLQRTWNKGSPITTNPNGPKQSEHVKERERERKRSKKRVLATESSIVNHFPNVTFCQKSLWKLSRSVKAAHLARQQTVGPSGQSGHAESNLWRRHQVKQTSSES